MARTVKVRGLFDGHVALDIESLDRIYLNGYVPTLQVGGQVAGFMTRHRPVWTIKQVRNLRMTTDLESTADIIDIGRTLAYELIKNNGFRVRLLRLGRRVLVPVPELLRLLGSTPAESESK
jgi:hypothetical protein